MEAVGVAPAEMYAPTTRYAIALLGLVVAIQVLPNGVLPLLVGAQVAIPSPTLQIGDRV